MTMQINNILAMDDVEIAEVSARAAHDAALFAEQERICYGAE